jgi:FkbM family methyltransferase
MDIATRSGRTITVDEIYRLDFESEEPIRQELWHIQEGDTVLDIGASLGIYTLPALACGARVFAVDILDDPHTSPLAVMARDNGIDEKLVVIRCAVGDEDGYPPWLADALIREHSTYPGLSAAEMERDGLGWSTIDKLVSGYCIDKVDWIKIDTEGGEWPILLGARKTLERDHPKLLVEEHSHIPWVHDAQSGPNVYRYLNELGYGVRAIPYDNRELWWCV